MGLLDLAASTGRGLLSTAGYGVTPRGAPTQPQLAPQIDPNVAPPQWNNHRGIVGDVLDQVLLGGAIHKTRENQFDHQAAAYNAAQQQAQLKQIESTITDPNELALFRANPSEWAKARGSNFEAANVAGGDTRFMPGRPGGNFTAPKLVGDNGVYGTQTADGYQQTGARGASIAEAHTAAQDDPNTFGGEGWNRVQANKIAQGNLAVNQGQLGVSRGQLGVAQGTLGLGQQKLDWEKAGGPARNTAALTAQQALPAVIDNANQFLGDIEKVKNDPQLSWRTGASGMIPAVPGSKGAGFDARVAQLQGQTFLQAYQGLKGGGQITEVEGKKAQEAIARLNRAQSKEDFTGALDDLSSVVKTGVARAQRAAAGNFAPQGSVVPAASAAMPKIGTVQRGYRFVGGNPSSPASWVKQ